MKTSAPLSFHGVSWVIFLIKLFIYGMNPSPLRLFHSTKNLSFPAEDGIFDSPSDAVHREIRNPE